MSQIEEKVYRLGRLIRIKLSKIDGLTEKRRERLKKAQNVYKQWMEKLVFEQEKKRTSISEITSKKTGAEKAATPCGSRLAEISKLANLTIQPVVDTFRSYDYQYILEKKEKIKKRRKVRPNKAKTGKKKYYSDELRQITEIILSKARERAKDKPINQPVMITINFSKDYAAKLNKTDKKAQAFTKDLINLGFKNPTLAVLESSKTISEVNHVHILTYIPKGSEKATRDKLRKFGTKALNSVMIQSGYNKTKYIEPDDHLFELECEEHGYPPENPAIKNDYWLNTHYRKPVAGRRGKLVTRIDGINLGAADYLSKELINETIFKERVGAIGIKKHIKEHREHKQALEQAFRAKYSG